MTLIKTGLFSAIAVVVRILTALALNKILASFVGPQGYAVIGQFQNFVAMLTTMAGAAVNSGVTKYTAEHFDDQERTLAVWRTAGSVSLASAALLGLAVIVASGPLSVWVLKDIAFREVFVWLGACLWLVTLNTFFMAILNGKKDIRRYVGIGIAGSVVGLIVSGGLAMRWGLHGALVAFAVNQSVVFFVTLVLCRHLPWLRFANLFGRIDRRAARQLAQFALMALTSAICVPVGQLLVRDTLVAQFGWTAAGHWDAMNRISGLYLTIVTTPLVIYYLPRLSEIRDRIELRSEILRGYALILPVTIVGAGVLYLLRDLVVGLLFTPAFGPMRELFAFQLLGDVLKIGSFLLAHLLLARAMTMIYVVSEIGFTALLVLLVRYLSAHYGVQGAVMAYAATYALYWGFMVGLMCHKFRLTDQK